MNGLLAEMDVDHSWFDGGWSGENPGIPGTRTNWAGRDSSPFEHEEPLRGEDCLPDAAFFVESWTLGPNAAAENFRRRNQGCPREPFAPPPQNSFLPFVASAEWLQATAVPLPGSLASAGNDDIVNDAIDDVTGRMTVERARILLGVTAASTRDQIKSAYRQTASRCHPDRAQGDRQRGLATERMAMINEAYHLLRFVRPDPSA